MKGITLPEGKTLQFKYDKEQQRADILKEMGEVMNSSQQKTPSTTEEFEQAKQCYLTFLLGENA